MTAAFDYNALQEVATELLDRFGRDVTFTRSSQTPADASRPHGSTETNGQDARSISARAVFTSPQDDDQPLSTVQQRVRRVFVASSAFPNDTLDTSWRLLDGPTSYEILEANPIQPGDTLLLFQLSVQI